MSSAVPGFTAARGGAREPLPAQVSPDERDGWRCGQDPPESRCEQRVSKAHERLGTPTQVLFVRPRTCMQPAQSPLKAQHRVPSEEMCDIRNEHGRAPGRRNTAECDCMLYERLNSTVIPLCPLPQLVQVPLRPGVELRLMGSYPTLLARARNTPAARRLATQTNRLRAGVPAAAGSPNAPISAAGR